MRIEEYDRARTICEILHCRCLAGSYIYLLHSSFFCTHNFFQVSVRGEICSTSLSNFETLMIAVGGDILGRSSEILEQLQVRRVFGFLQQVIFKTSCGVGA